MIKKKKKWFLNHTKNLHPLTLFQTRMKAYIKLKLNMLYHINKWVLMDLYNNEPYIEVWTEWKFVKKILKYYVDAKYLQVFSNDIELQCFSNSTHCYWNHHAKFKLDRKILTYQNKWSQSYPCIQTYVQKCRKV